MTTITSLKTLLDALKSIDEARHNPERFGVDPTAWDAADQAERALAECLGLPIDSSGMIDSASMPTFGGDEPASTLDVWSWDATHLLVGTCAADLEIVARDSR